MRWRFMPWFPPIDLLSVFKRRAMLMLIMRSTFLSKRTSPLDRLLKELSCFSRGTGVIHVVIVITTQRRKSMTSETQAIETTEVPEADEGKATKKASAGARRAHGARSERPVR